MIKPKKILENLSPYETDFYKQDWRLKLDANENIYGCANNVISAIKNIPPQDICLYPTYGKLIDKVSEKYQINKNNILFSNGCDEALSVLVNAYLEEDEEILAYEPTFSMPFLYAKIMGSKTRYIEYDEKFVFDINVIRKNISQNAKIVYIATPNNPTGEIARASLIETLVNEYPQILFIVDCTYINFSTVAMFEDYVDLSKKYDNIAVVKSYSKDFGIAGLRFGLILADESIIKNLKKVISPYSVNAIAINCALMIINDEKRIEEIKELNLKAKELLNEILLNSKYKPYPSEANFVLCDFMDHCEFYFRKLKNYGVITRKYSKSSKLNSCLRITVPTLGGVKYIAELLVKKDVLIFDYETIFENRKSMLSREDIEKLSKTYDFVIVSNGDENEVENVLKENEIEKFVHLITNDKNVLNTLEKTSYNNAKYFSANLENIICAKQAQIEIVGVITKNMNQQNAINNYRHIGVDYILGEIENLKIYIKDEKLCLE